MKPSLTLLATGLLAISGGAGFSEDAPATVQGTSVQLQSKTGTLYGSLDLPSGSGPFPVVILHAGSGPTDRDGNQKLMKNDSLKMLGAGLAASGIAVLRYDKRAIGASAAAGSKPEDLRFDMYVDDMVGWIDFLRKDKRFTKVGILGHSEGSLIGMLAARRGKAGAFVSIAGPGHSAAVVLRKQLANNLAARPALREKSDKIIDELIAGRTVAEVPPELVSLYPPSLQPYLISWFKYDPATAIGELEMPILIVQGTTDNQITVEDAKRLAAAKKEAQLCLIEGMNHVLKHASTDPEQKAAYTDATVPLEGKVVEEIGRFLSKNLAKP
jgi:pimeloyl-ACP methyl ester carboxylesterase